MIFQWGHFLPNRWWKPSAWNTWKSYLHWRLETYGIYYPDEHVNWKALRSLLRQFPAYSHWLDHFQKTRTIPYKSHS